MVYRDSSGRALTDYERPSVAVDVAVLTAAPDQPLCVVVTRENGEPRLPGTFLFEGERLADAARRALKQKASLTGVRPQQLHVFDRPGRDDRGWVLSVAHLGAIGWTKAERLDLIAIDDLPPMPYDHREIVDRAAAELRRRYELEPDPFGLLADGFTLRELQLLHEAVAGDSVMRDAFRRRMERMLEPTGDRVTRTVGKPARLWRRISK